jgi:serine/threonine protein kinase
MTTTRHCLHHQAIDWWSLGIVAFEMVTGWPPFFDRNFNVMCEKILRKPVQLPAKFEVSEAARSFVCGGLLQRDPTLRLGNTPLGFKAFEQVPGCFEWD